MSKFLRIKHYEIELSNDFCVNILPKLEEDRTFFIAMDPTQRWYIFSHIPILGINDQMHFASSGTFIEWIPTNEALPGSPMRDNTLFRYIGSVEHSVTDEQAYTSLEIISGEYLLKSIYS